MDICRTCVIPLRGVESEGKRGWICGGKRALCKLTNDDLGQSMQGEGRGEIFFFPKGTCWLLRGSGEKESVIEGAINISVGSFIERPQSCQQIQHRENQLFDSSKFKAIHTKLMTKFHKRL